MVSLSDKVKDALDEVRILILGAQILLGFQFSAAFQPKFDDLAPVSRGLDALAYALMLLAAILLMAPAPFHRLVEHGNDTVRLHRYITHMAMGALLPFALCIGLDEFIVVEGVLGRANAAAAGALLVSCAIAAWYGFEWLRRKSPPERHRSEKEKIMRTPLKEKIRTVGTEIRVVLPGAQAVLGFQFAAVLSDRFAKLPAAAQLLHIGSLTAIAIAVILLMAPAAYHRIVAGGEDYRDVDIFSARSLLAAMIVLGLGLAGDFYLVLGIVSDWQPSAAIGAALALLSMFGLWFGYPLLVRRPRRSVG